MKKIILLITISLNLTCHAGPFTDLANIAKDIKETTTSLYQGSTTQSTSSGSIPVSNVNTQSIH